MALSLLPMLALAGTTAEMLAACSGCSRPSNTDEPGDAGSKPDGYVIPKFDAASPVDAGEDVYGSNWDAGDLLGDSTIWTPVPDNKDCGLFAAWDGSPALRASSSTGVKTLWTSAPAS